MKMRNFILILLSMILLAGCGNGDTAPVQETASGAPETETTPETTLADTLTTAD